MSASDVAGVSR